MTTQRAFVPLDTAAVAAGGDAVAEALTAAGCAVTRTGSRGLCWAEPLVELGESRLAFANVAAADVPTLLAEGAGHPKCLGPIGQLGWLTQQTRLVFDRIGDDHPLRLRKETVLSDCLHQSPGALIDEIEASGLRGRGGAGFPAHIKWRTVRDMPADRKFLVCNADEGDSGTFADRLLLEGDPHRLIEGMTVAALATGATEGYVYLRSEYPIAARIFRQALDDSYAAGLLGRNLLGSGHAFDLHLFIGAGAYICGEETSLLESLEGKRGEIRAKPPVPAVSGLLGKPTLVHNVISFASVPAIMRLGGAAYADIGVGRSTGSMCFQLAGNIARGGLVEAPFGMPIRRLIEDFGGGTRSGRPLKAVQIGGPLGAYLRVQDLSVPLTYEALAELGAGIGHGGLVAFDDSVDLGRQARYAFEFCEVESCGKCTPCRIGSVRGKETLDALLHARAAARQARSLGRSVAAQDEARMQANSVIIRDLCEVMESASLCQMGGMTPIPVLSAMQRFPEDFQA